MIYTVTSGNLHIAKSYEYKRSEMEDAIMCISALHPHCLVWQRSLRSLVSEWMVHNALYRLHILRSHTADADLNYPCRVEWLYIALAPLAALIIK